MTERLADISARIEGIHQLGAVVNAMKGIAAARAHVARSQVKAVDEYAATVAAAMSSVGEGKSSTTNGQLTSKTSKTGLLVFCAEQGFAGAFSERILDNIGSEIDPTTLFLIGTRGISIALARGIVPGWAKALPSHTPRIPKLADHITTAIYEAVAERRVDRLDVVFSGWNVGQATIERKVLFPLNLSDVGPSTDTPPLTTLPLANLIESLGRDFFHAQVCKAALHAFAAENEARVVAMTAASNQINRELETFQGKLNRVRQEAITAEIIELGSRIKTSRDLK